MPAHPPDPALAQKSQLGHFLRLTGLKDYPALYQKSIEEPTWLTHQMLTFLRIRLETPFEEACCSGGLYSPDWIHGGTLNASRLITENAPSSQIALAWENEQGESRSWSYRAFSAVSRRAATTFLNDGVILGGQVVIPKNPTLETIAALVASARIGAIATESKDPDFTIETDPWDSLNHQPNNLPPIPLPPEAILLDQRTHGAFVIKAALDLAFVGNVGRGSRFGWFGKDPWMLLGALALGATVVLFDPKTIENPDRLWALCAHQNIEVIGLTPRIARELPAMPGDRHNLDRLQTIIIDGLLDESTFARLHKLNGAAGQLAVLQYQDGVRADNLLCPTDPGNIQQCCLGAITSC